MKVRAIRGATQLRSDDRAELESAVCEMISTILNRNGLKVEDLISIFFTSTPDLICDFPAAAARKLDLGSIPLICSVEIAVPDSLPRTVRAMGHAYSPLSHEEISHIYIRGAESLRKDLAQ